MPTEFEYDVFLSYNKADKTKVGRLAERLKADGLAVWFDEWVIKAGDDIYLSIERGLQDSRVLVLCLSQAALGSEWVNLERSTGLFRDPSNSARRFIPLLIGECQPPDTLRRYKYVDYRDENPAAIEEVVSACGSISNKGDLSDGHSSNSRKTIFEIRFGKDNEVNADEAQTKAIDEVVNCMTSGDLLGAGEWYASIIPFVSAEESADVAWKVIGLWSSPHSGTGVPKDYAALISMFHEFVAEDMAVAIVATVARLRWHRQPIPANVGDLAFRLSPVLGRVFGNANLRPSELVTSCVAKHDALSGMLFSAVGNFRRSDCIGAKSAGIELLKQLKVIKPCALAAERPILSELDMLLGPAFRSFCESCQHRKMAEVAKYASIVREQASRMLSNVGSRKNSTLWQLCVKSVAKHLIYLIDEESRQSEQATIPCLGLSSTILKLDLSRVNREMTFSCRLANRGQGLAKDIRLIPDTTQVPADLKLVIPTRPFEAGGESEEVVTFAMTLRGACKDLSIPLNWHCISIRGTAHISSDTLTVHQQQTQPDWNRLRRDPPYGLNSVKTRDKLFGRETVLNQLIVLAAGGTSAFFMGCQAGWKNLRCPSLRG